MAWTAYHLSLRLCSPLHSGWRKVGNLQRTRPYATGRNLWGALTACLAVTSREGMAPDRDPGALYQEIGVRVEEQLAFTYLYPSTAPESVGLWPWGRDWTEFSWTFLGSYTSTALDNGRSAEAGSLHETEYITPQSRPRTIDVSPSPVYLVGYIFERDDCKLAWRSALETLRLGGERGYGWGRVRLIGEPRKVDDAACFGNGLDCHAERPVLSLPPGHPLLAHTLTTSAEVTGEIEPFIGRETTDAGRFGQRLSQAQVCWAPGSMTLHREQKFRITHKGIWERL